MPEAGWSDRLLDYLIWGRAIPPNARPRDNNQTKIVRQKREDAREKLENYNKYPSEAKAQKLESIIGINPDYHEILDDREPLKE